MAIVFQSESVALLYWSLTLPDMASLLLQEMLLLPLADHTVVAVSTFKETLNGDSAVRMPFVAIIL